MTGIVSSECIVAIKESLDKGWGVDYDHRFFLLKDFEQTDFKKTSPGGIFRVRYFNLENIFEKVPEQMKQIADELKTQEWK